MQIYMTQFSYTTEAWQALMKNPEDRTGVLKAVIEKLGGRMISLYYCFGDYDGVAIAEYPDSVSAAATVLSAISGGHVKAMKTTALLSASEMVKAINSLIRKKHNYSKPIKRQYEFAMNSIGG